MPKRGENIYKRKDGRWEGRIKGMDFSVNGGKYKSIYGKTYKEVRKKMNEFRKELPHGKNPCILMMKEASEIWLQEKKTEWKATTYRIYRQIVDKYIIPFLGDVKVNRLDYQVLRDFRVRLNDEKDISLSERYQSYICSIVRQILLYTKSKYNPEIQIPEFPVFKNKKNKTMLPSDTALAALENYLLENVEEDTCLGIAIALYMGIRIGELCALTWKDIDLKENVIRIQGNMQRVRETAEGEKKTKVAVLPPKTADSVRTIPIPPLLFPLLKEHQKEENSFVISGKKNGWIDTRTLQYRFERILQKCGIAYFNFHMLRHAFATRCVSMGFDIKSLSEILGHSNVKITMSLYVHPTMQQKKQWMDKLVSYETSLCCMEGHVPYMVPDYQPSNVSSEECLQSL